MADSGAPPRGARPRTARLLDAAATAAELEQLPQTLDSGHRPPLHAASPTAGTPAWYDTQPPYDGIQAVALGFSAVPAFPPLLPAMITTRVESANTRRAVPGCGTGRLGNPIAAERGRDRHRHIGRARRNRRLRPTIPAQDTPTAPKSFVPGQLRPAVDHNSALCGIALIHRWPGRHPRLGTPLHGLGSQSGPAWSEDVCGPSRLPSGVLTNPGESS